MTWFSLVLISALFLSFRTILFKKILGDKNTLPVLFLSTLFLTILMLFFYRELSFSLSPFMLFLIIIKSIIIAAGWFFIFQAYKYLPISTVSPLRNLSPVILIVLSFFILGESVSLINYIGIFLLILSAYFLEVKSLKHIFEPLKFFKSKYFLFIFFSMTAGSISAILDKIILKSVDTYSLMFYYFLFISIIYFFVLLFQKEIKSLKPFLTKSNILTLFLIAVSMFMADMTYFNAVALPGTLIILIIPLRRLSTFLSTLFGGIFFHEKRLLQKSIICLVMIFAVYLIMLN